MAKQLSNIQDGYQAFVLKKLLRQNKKHCHVVPTDVHLAFLKEVLSLVGEKTETIENGVTIIDDVRDKDS